MGEHAMESLLRPAVELYTVGICAGAGALCLHSPWAVALSPEVGTGMALAYTAFGLKRLNEARIVLRYVYLGQARFADSCGPQHQGVPDTFAQRQAGFLFLRLDAMQQWRTTHWR